MSKPNKDIMPYISIAISLIVLFWGNNIIGSPVKEVKAYVNNLAGVVSELKTKPGSDIDEIKANVKTLTDGQKETRDDIKELLKRTK